MRNVTTLFDGLRARARAGIVVETVAWSALAAATFVFVSYAADRTLRLEVPFRIFLLGVAVTAVGWIWWRRFVQPFRVELTDEELALAVERQDPTIRQSLISAVQFQRDLAGERPDVNESRALMQRVIQRVEQALDGLPFHRAVDGRRTARFAGLLLGCMAAVGGWAAVSDDAGLWAFRNLALADEPWPRATRFEFVDLDPAATVRIAERDDFTVRVRAVGVVPDAARLECVFDGGTTSERPMERIGADVFTATLDTVLESTRVRAFGGDGLSPELRVEIVPRPNVSELAVAIDYPGYLGRQRETVADLAADITIPRGSTVHLAARSDKRLTSAAIVLADDMQIDAIVADGGHSIAATWQPQTSGAVTLDVLDEDRLGASNAEQLYLRLVDDEAPDVEFRARGIGALITADARIPGTLEVRDDYAIMAVSAAFQITEAVAVTEPDAPVVEVPFEPAPVTGLGSFTPGSPAFEADTVFDLRDLMPSEDPIEANRRVKPGTLLALRFTAADGFEPVPHVRDGEPMHFRVVTRERLLEELKRRQLEQRRELEQVLARETTTRDRVQEIMAPRGETPGAEEARLELLTLARRQQALGRRVQGIGERYRRILDELSNNRLFDDTVTRQKHARIVSPLSTMAAQDFPATAAAIAAFAESGDESAREPLVARIDAILAAMQRVLDEMEHAEDISALLEALRAIIRTEEEARRLIERERADAVDDLFDDPDAPKDGR